MIARIGIAFIVLGGFAALAHTEPPPHEHLILEEPVTSDQPRGIRNRNPGNIEKSDDKWEGLADPPDDGTFFVFDSAVYGIRAAAIILLNYQDEHGLRTLEEIVGRWAPASENDVDGYVEEVQHVSGLPLDTDLNLHDWQTMYDLLDAIIWEENGEQPYPPDVMVEGLAKAGIPLPEPQA